MLDQIAGTEQNYAVFTFADQVAGGSVITMKAEDESVVGEWSLTNDLTYLIVSGAYLEEGTYTLWKDGVQLATGGSMMGMGGRGMGGQMDQMPENGEMPEGMEIPENGEMQKGGQMQDGMGGRGGMGQTSGEVTTEFVISKGANYFSCQVAE